MVLALVLLWSALLEPVAGPALTRNTIRLALLWYWAALLLLIRSPRRARDAGTRLGRTARWCWTWGMVCFVVHVALAFHYYHHWSHAHAFEHVRQVGGVGEGIYASYLFTALWIADAVWWWCRPASYAARSRRWNLGMHAYMLFIAFNGTIVFEAGTVRWVGAVAFGSLAAAWIMTRVDSFRPLSSSES
jgi:hypothetical protein